MFHKLLPVNPQMLNIPSLPSNIQIEVDDNTPMKDYNVAIMGYNPEISYPVRNSLYKLSFNAFKELSILDLGDAMSMSNEEIAELIYHLTKNSIFPILIGFDKSIMIAISNHWGGQILPHSICWIDSQIKQSHTSSLDQNIFIKQQFFIGLQRHLLSDECHQSINRNGKPIYLSEYRKNNQSIESYIRNSELIYMNLNSVRYSDFPNSNNPSGFFSEEIISLAKSCGSSDKSTLAILSDWTIHNSSIKINSELAAHMVWYILEGFILKLKDHRNKTKNLTHYVVELKNSDIHLDFFKSESSGKWWIQEPSHEENFHGNLIPCTYEEYLKTVHENLPERLLELIYQ